MRFPSFDNARDLLNPKKDLFTSIDSLNVHKMSKCIRHCSAQIIRLNGCLIDRGKNDLRGGCKGGCGVDILKLIDFVII